MTNRAADIKSYLTFLAEEDIKNVENVLKFNDKELSVYKDLLNKFKTANGSNASTKIKGSCLEELVLFVIKKSVVFEVFKNVKTTSNEIDLLVRLNAKGHLFKNDGFLNFQENFLCECKNYNKKIDVTWAGKFYSLLKLTQNDLGILFSYHGLTGNGNNNWSYASGLTKKLFLLNEKKTSIIDFNINDFELLSQGKSFIEIVNNKILSLQLDTNIESLISNHPNESFFN